MTIHDLNNCHNRKSVLQSFWRTVVLGNLCKSSAILLVAVGKATQGQPVDSAACVFPRFSPLCILKGAGKINSKQNLLRASESPKNIKPLNAET